MTDQFCVLTEVTVTSGYRCDEISGSSAAREEQAPAKLRSPRTVCGQVGGTYQCQFSVLWLHGVMGTSLLF